MPPMPTIQLPRPMARACLFDAAELRMADGGLRISDSELNPKSEIRNPQSDDLLRELQHQKDKLAQLLQTVNSMAEGLRTLHEQTLAGNHAEIAKLAVEIARRILMYKAGKGDYEIQAIVEEALKQAPTRQHVIVHLNPGDLPPCQQLQQENPQSPWAELELTADWSVGRGECLVETPKGIVRSFLEEHLERISEALQRVE